MKNMLDEKNCYINKLNNYLSLINQIFISIDQNNYEMTKIKYKELKVGLKEDYHVYNTQREIKRVSKFGKTMYYPLIMETYVKNKIKVNASPTKIREAVLIIETELRNILNDIKES